MTEDPDKPAILRRHPDPLGYDTRRPFHEVAKEMAEDALVGRHQDAVAEELRAVRRAVSEDPERLRLTPGAMRTKEEQNPLTFGRNS